jgi:O-antigen ligase
MEAFSTQLDARSLSRGSWYAPRLAFFSMAVDTSGQSVDVGEVALIGPDGSNVLVNGDFSRDMARWMPISEKYDLPWHIKNLALDVIFDQGFVGLVLFVFLLLAALARLVFGTTRRQPFAPYLAAALAGFVVVGAFDSLLDVPRVAFLFYLILLTSLILPTGRPSEPAPSP